MCFCIVVKCIITQHTEIELRLKPASGLQKLGPFVEPNVGLYTCVGKP